MTHPEIIKAEATGYGFDSNDKAERESVPRRAYSICGGCGQTYVESFFIGPFWNQHLNASVADCCLTRTEAAL